MKTRAAVLVSVVALFAIAAGSAGAGQVDEQCLQPSGGNGATACTLILHTSTSGLLESDVVTQCLGEDVFLDLDAKAVAHQVFRPDGTSELTGAHAEFHGTGYGVVTGTKVEFDEPGTEFIDDLPGGGEIFHAIASANVATQGGAANLELTIEAQEVIAPDGTVVNSTLNEQAKCGSDHESEHDT